MFSATLLLTFYIFFQRDTVIFYLPIKMLASDIIPIPNVYKFLALVWELCLCLILWGVFLIQAAANNSGNVCEKCGEEFESRSAWCFILFANMLFNLLLCYFFFSNSSLPFFRRNKEILILIPSPWQE